MDKQWDEASRQEYKELWSAAKEVVRLRKR